MLQALEIWEFFLNSMPLFEKRDGTETVKNVHFDLLQKVTYFGQFCGRVNSEVATTGMLSSRCTFLFLNLAAF
jgi:hypothetical protein